MVQRYCLFCKMPTLYCKIYIKNIVYLVSCTFCCNFAVVNLHIFNPEHDIALAFGGSNFTSPRAGRLLRSDLCFLPVLWAEDGDCILVDDVERARREVDALPVALPEVSFVTLADLRSGEVCRHITGVEPWGWDAAIVRQMERGGVPRQLMPSDEELVDIRMMSSRRWAAMHLGNSGVCCESLGDAMSLCAKMERFVLKSPWSSSGRGVRYTGEWAWAGKVIDSQGCIMVEPYCEKVVDFAMEFSVDMEGRVGYCGLSVFDTAGGAYTGNVLASEKRKMQMLLEYVPEEMVAAARQNVIKQMSSLILNKYIGVFGVDMMICRDGGSYRIIPCVELNLRRTMGHVALALTEKMSQTTDALLHHMWVEYVGNQYRLRIEI